MTFRAAARVALSFAAAGMLVAGLLVLLTRGFGVRWVDAAAAVAGMPALWAVAATVLWAAGLCAYSLVLTAALPGLGTRQALSLNMAGSAVGNSVPMGGAISMALTSAMTSSWGFNRLATGTFLTVSSTWNLAMRLVFGIAALAWLSLSASGSALTTAMTVPALVVAAALVVLLTLTLVRPRAACAVSAWAGALADRVRPQRSPAALDRRHRWALAVLRLSGQVRRIVRRSWPRMTTGMAGYAILLTALLWVCLIAVGASSPAPAAVICAVAVERMVTAVPITPGGAGVAEVALVAVLHAGGVDPVQAVAAALVFRAFTYGMEIPLGAGVALAWLARRRWPVRRGAVA